MNIGNKLIDFFSGFWNVVCYLFTSFAFVALLDAFIPIPIPIALILMTLVMLVIWPESEKVRATVPLFFWAIVGLILCITSITQIFTNPVLAIVCGLFGLLIALALSTVSKPKLD